MVKEKIGGEAPVSLAEAAVVLGSRRWKDVKMLAFKGDEALLTLENGESLRIWMEGDDGKELFRILGAEGAM